MDESREANRTDDDVTARTFFVGDDEEEPDPEIARYESMPIEQVNAELHEHGVGSVVADRRLYGVGAQQAERQPDRQAPAQPAQQTHV